MNRILMSCDDYPECPETSTSSISKSVWQILGLNFQKGLNCQKPHKEMVLIKKLGGILESWNILFLFTLISRHVMISI